MNFVDTKLSKLLQNHAPLPVLQYLGIPCHQIEHIHVQHMCHMCSPSPPPVAPPMPIQYQPLQFPLPFHPQHYPLVAFQDQPPPPHPPIPFQYQPPPPFNLHPQSLP